MAVMTGSPKAPSLQLPHLADDEHYARAHADLQALRARKANVARELEALESRPRAESPTGHATSVGVLLANPAAPLEELQLDAQDLERIRAKRAELRAASDALKHAEVAFTSVRDAAAGRLLHAHVRGWKRQQAMRIVEAAAALGQLFDHDAAVSRALHDRGLENSWSLVARIAGSADVAALRQRLEAAGLLDEGV